MLTVKKKCNPMFETLLIWVVLELIQIRVQLIISNPQTQQHNWSASRKSR